MFMAKGCEIANAPTWKGPERCTAPPTHAEAGADAESPTQCWAHRDAISQRSVPAPRGPNPAQLGLRDAFQVGGLAAP